MELLHFAQTELRLCATTSLLAKGDGRQRNKTRRYAMARLRLGQKTQRLLAFLMGLGNPAIVRSLQPYGFDQAALDEGWTLLRRTAAVRLSAQPTLLVLREEILRLDAWENEWFPIAAAVLGRHHPEVNEKVFYKLSQTEGNEVVLSVGTFLERVDALAKEGQLAPLATLARHGLTDTVLDQARGLLAKVAQPPFEPEPPKEPSTAAAEDEPVLDPAAEDAMWSYYLQWSAIARTAITDRRLLRQLGFLRPQRGTGSGEELDPELPGDLPETEPAEPDAGAARA
jgi:hypothetical protein